MGREDFLLKHEIIEEQHWVDRYLMGKLAEDEVAQFEEHYFHCQPCQEALKLGQHMQRGFKSVAAQHMVEARVVQRAAAFAWLRRRQGALGAVMMLALMALPTAWMWRHSTDLERQLQTTRSSLDAERQQALVSTPAPSMTSVPEAVPNSDGEQSVEAQLAQQQADFERQLSSERQRAEELSQALIASHQPSGNTQVLYLGAERSAAPQTPSHRLQLPTEPTWIVLALEIEPGAHPSYRAELFDAQGQSIWQGDSLRLDVQDTVNLSVHSSFLQAGDYRLELEGETPSSGSGSRGFEAVGTFALRID